LLVGASWTSAVRRGHGYDFGAFYAASEAVRGGGSPYGTAVRPPYVYPPLPAQVGAALPRWPRDAADRACCALGSVAALAAFGLLLLGRARRDSDEDDALAVTVGLALLGILPFRDTLLQGQVNGLVVLALAAALWFEWRGRPLAAGVSLAPAVLLKLTPLTFALWWVARRRTAALAGLAWATVALVLGSIMAGGGPWWASYLRLLRDLAAGGGPPGLPPRDALYNLSLTGLAARLLPAWLAGPAAMVALLVLAALAARAAARAATPAAQHGALLAVLALTVMAPPLAYRHHVVLLFPALLPFLVDGLRARDAGRVAFAALGTLLASVNFPDRAAYLRLDAAGGAWRLLTALNLYGLLLLFALGSRYASGGGRLADSGGMSSQGPAPPGT
ncbi:MAG TPA: glycosyltransferase family 87 protein, partial [Vicinamibacteria bacterium]